MEDSERDLEQQTEAFARSLLQQRMEEPFSRRQFVQRAGGAVLATSLGANLLAAGAAAAPEAPSATLNMIIWDGYDDKQASAAVRKRLSIKTNPTYIGNNEQIFTKLRAGGVGSVDLVTPYHGYIKVLIEADLLEPLDYAKLPNTKNYFGRFKNPAWARSGGEVYAAPYIWGTDPMMYNAKFVKTPPRSWMDVMKPEYKGKIVMVDDTLGQIMVWGRVLGYKNPVRITKKQLDEVIALLTRIKKTQARAFASSWGDMADIMSRGDGWISTGGWEAITSFGAAKGADLRFTHPKEGDFAWTDSWCIPKDAPNSDTAYQWIDWMISPRAQAIVARNLVSGAVNKNAVAVMDKKTRSIYPYANLAPIFKKAPNFDIPPREQGGRFTTLDQWNEAWARLRAA
jgi:spermidine/putrescine transport system substrate-binding protein